jgi:1,4-dihydroxy-2-naphthoate octaprenyltransferase
MAEASKLKAWISAARLRTLPLSISGILVGSAYAYYSAYAANFQYKPNAFELAINQGYFHNQFFAIVLLALITTLGFQVLSNFANDYGDGVKGTDNEDRIGPMRALQSGIISPKEMKRAMLLTALLTLISAILLIYVSLGIERLLVSLFFLVLGIAAIWAAIKYTVGDNAYGYRGLGDVFVFIFFGPVSVMGIYYLITKTINWEMIFPSITIGLLSVAVLNLNNMRDVESDKKAGKNTIVVKLGLAKAKVLHYGFILVAFIGAILTTTSVYHDSIAKANWKNLEKRMNIDVLNIPNAAYNEGLQPELGISLFALLPLLAFIPLFVHLLKVKKTIVPALLDPELKKVALSTFFFAILCVLSVWILT